MNIRQRRWLELIKDYDCEIHYHPSKVNVATDALEEDDGSSDDVPSKTFMKGAWEIKS